MKTTLSMVAFLATTSVFAGGDIIPVAPVPTPVPVVEDVLKASAQLRFGYININPELAGVPTSYETALGGQVKVETVDYYGFSLGAAFYTSHAITDWSGDRDLFERSYDLTSDPEGHYDLLAEAYIAYKINDFSIKVGRQLIDTPYADSDDIRMTPNTFEGVVASYGMGDFSLIAAYLTKWQGPDAGVYEFVDLLGPDADGVVMAAATYASDNIEAGLWYYGADQTTDVIYGDITATYTISDGFEITGALQAANQSERDNSGIEGTLFGAIAELAFSGVTLGVAYNTLDVDDEKEYFGGFGGGVGFVNMDEMTAGAFTVSQGADTYKFGIAYDFSEIGANGFAASYDYGHFEGDKEFEANEQNFILSYANDEKWDVELVYSIIEDVNKDFGEDEFGNPADGGFSRVLARANYNF